ncbi:hypothetical protein [Nannocystis exedens]|nr:hypothetical protein [Nannocystis exedens]
MKFAAGLVVIFVPACDDVDPLAQQDDELFAHEDEAAPRRELPLAGPEHDDELSASTLTCATVPAHTTTQVQGISSSWPGFPYSSVSNQIVPDSVPSQDGCEPRWVADFTDTQDYKVTPLGSLAWRDDVSEEDCSNSHADVDVYAYYPNATVTHHQWLYTGQMVLAYNAFTQQWSWQCQLAIDPDSDDLGYETSSRSYTGADTVRVAVNAWSETCLILDPGEPQYCQELIWPQYARAAIHVEAAP